MPAIGFSLFKLQTKTHMQHPQHRTSLCGALNRPQRVKLTIPYHTLTGGDLSTNSLKMR